MAKAQKNHQEQEPIEKQLWKAADKLRKNIDAAEYKHIVLGLIFLRYISDAFEALHAKLRGGQGEYAGADPEDRDEYKAENVFFVPETARWAYLQSKAKQPTIGKDVDQAMDAIEKENPALKDVLPKVFARGDLVWLIDFTTPENNDFFVVNQYAVVEHNFHKRLDMVLFVNGLPLVVIELKNPADEHATIYSAFQQIQTYKHTLPTLFSYNGFLVISDGLEARAGTISSGFSRFMAWKSADGKSDASPLIGQLETLITGMLHKNTLLDLIRHFIVFERARHTDPKTGVMTIHTEKKLAAYHQYYAVNRAVESTLRDALPNATYLGFTGTPIEKTDVNTPAVFGNYVDIYDIVHAVTDGATVRIFYESRLAKITLSEEGRRLIEEFDDDLAQDELTETQKAKAKWTQLEALIGSQHRIQQIARDIMTHFEQRQTVMDGKALIVTMSRRILAERMKNPEDELKIVIVRDMWLTGCVLYGDCQQRQRARSHEQRHAQGNCGGAV